MTTRLWNLTRFKLLILVAAAFWWGGQQIGHLLREAQDTPPPPARVGNPQRLAQEHDCWGGGEKAPVKIPGHAVVAINGGAPRFVGPRLTSHALEHVFEGKHPHLRVIAFCR